MTEMQLDHTQTLGYEPEVAPADGDWASDVEVAEVAEHPFRLLVQQEPVTFRSAMTREQFHRFVLSNADYKIERDASGLITIHPPMTFDSGFNEGEAFYALKHWSKSNAFGRAFSPSTSFDLPDGSQYKADGSWISMEKINRLTPEERKHIPVIVPDFVIEVRSETDRIGKLKKKMTEAWIANGVRLAWLIDPLRERAWVYRADGSMEEVRGFQHRLLGEDVLPGFELALEDLKNPGEI